MVKRISETIAIYKDKEWDEFRVRIKGSPEADYHTDDLADAFETAAAMEREESERKIENMKLINRLGGRR